MKIKHSKGIAHIPPREIISAKFVSIFEESGLIKESPEYTHCVSIAGWSEGIYACTAETAAWVSAEIAKLYNMPESHKCRQVIPS